MMSLDKLKMIERKITTAVRMAQLVATLGFTELVVGVNENGQHSFQSFKAPKKASTFAPGACYVVPDIGIAAFNDMRIPLIADIASVLSRKDDSKIRHTAVSE